MGCLVLGFSACLDVFCPGSHLSTYLSPYQSTQTHRRPSVDWQAIMKLLDLGADADFASSNGITCLMMAAMEDPEALNYQYQTDHNGK